jgi:DNA-binding NtrC family response regulator
MTQAGDGYLKLLEAERAAIVFVSASAGDARAFRELVDGNRWLVVNVPDLIGARAAIDKLHPRLVVCDTRIEGQGSWRDLLRERDARPGFALVVASRHADAALWPEFLNLGAADVLEKPFAIEDVERVIVLAFQRAPEERGVVAGESVPHAAPCSRRG